MLFEAGWHSGIVVTQPRRIAAVSVSAHVAQELQSELGGLVGYSVRFEEKSDPARTKIKFVTDGMLIRETLSDPLLLQYGVVILDEAHERTVSTDVLLGLVKKIMKQRKDLKVIVSSATIETAQFYQFFHSKDRPCRVISVQGRSFPVDILNLREPCRNYVLKAVETAVSIHKNEKDVSICNQ
jgi:ATP-dependent RNA helicase DDX35